MLQPCLWAILTVTPTSTLIMTLILTLTPFPDVSGPLQRQDRCSVSITQAKIFVLGIKERRREAGGSSNAGDVILQSTSFESADMSPPGESVEQLTVNRLPGEPLGMECDVIDSDVTGPRVLVRRVISGSPAERASGGSRGVEVGDEILSINGVKLTTVSHVEILHFVTETPLTVILLIRRKVARLERSEKDEQTVDGDCVRPGYALQTCKPSVIHEGFELRQVTFHKRAGDKLALQLGRRSLHLHTYSQVVSLHISYFLCQLVLSSFLARLAELIVQPVKSCVCECVTATHRDLKSNMVIRILTFPGHFFLDTSPDTSPDTPTIKILEHSHRTFPGQFASPTLSLDISRSQFAFLQLSVSASQRMRCLL